MIDPRSKADDRPSAWRFVSACICLMLFAQSGHSQDAPSSPTIAASPSSQVLPSDDSSLVFTTTEWNEIEKAIDRDLVTLANEQNDDGSFGRTGSSQPAVTSLATMAFLSRGHQPGLGEHGDRVNRAIDYVLASQDRLGFFVAGNSYNSSSSTYSHAIAGVMLAEVLGLTDRRRNERIVSAIHHGLDATMKLQHRHYHNKIDRGGWRYMKPRTGVSSGSDADLSVTTWHMLFFWAAKNAGFDVPASLVTDCAGFVRRCHDAERNMFAYLPSRSGSITMTGAGVLCLNLAGEFNDPAMLAAAETLQDYAFDEMDETTAGPITPAITAHRLPVRSVEKFAATCCATSPSFCSTNKHQRATGRRWELRVPTASPMLPPWRSFPWYQSDTSGGGVRARRATLARLLRHHAQTIPFAPT